jgi:hypothetical protein
MKKLLIIKNLIIQITVFKKVRATLAVVIPSNVARLSLDTLS